MLWEGFPGHPLRKDFVTYDQSIAAMPQDGDADWANADPEALTGAGQ